MENKKKKIHTYEEDLAKAMNTTDASVIQELLNKGREKEEYEKIEKKDREQSRWYRLVGLILVFVGFAFFIYSFFYYQKLTVTVENNFSVGLFKNTEQILINSTDIRSLVKDAVPKLETETSKPLLIDLVNENYETVTNPKELFSFFEGKASEVLLSYFDNVRLGVVNTGEKNTTFIIASTKNGELVNKELMLSEDSLLQILYKPLGIDISKYTKEVGKSFATSYIYNIPVRLLNEESGDKDNIVLFYSQITDNIFIFSTNPNTLRPIHDTIIKQQN